jgi:hypothetical protein
VVHQSTTQHPNNNHLTITDKTLITTINNHKESSMLVRRAIQRIDNTHAEVVAWPGQEKATLVGLEVMWPQHRQEQLQLDR